jgi:hypothetical protein
MLEDEFAPHRGFLNTAITGLAPDTASLPKAGAATATTTLLDVTQSCGWLAVGRGWRWSPGRSAPLSGPR